MSDVGPERLPSGDGVTRLLDTKVDTNATRLWFLAIDPQNGHAPGPVAGWKNELTITHQPRNIAGKRQVELRVVPRGDLRYTLTGANPKEGALYDAPFEIGEGEVTVYCYAEHRGVHAVRNFTIAPAGKLFAIDPLKPARLKKRLSLDTSSETYSAIAQAKARDVELAGVTISIGAGTETVSLRFGSEMKVTAQSIERLVEVLRDVLGTAAGDVRLSVNTVTFKTGHDLQAFAAARKLELGANDVEQL